MINADKFVRGQHWLEGPFPIGTSLANKTLGIVGLGRIGEAIAERAIAFKLKIAYHNRQQKPVTYQYCESLEQLASISDILLCMLPGGNATRNMINREVLRALGPNGILINVGRGSSVDEDALVQALQRGAIAGAGLDVFADEPNVPDALLKLDNIFLLPHIGSATLETRTAMGQLVIDNLQAFFNGDGILTPVHT